MAFQKVGGGNRISMKKQQLGSEWSGTYTKHYEVESTMTKTGKQDIWQLTTDDGDITEFYGFASLDQKMKQVPLNSLVKIKYTNNYKTKRGQDAASVEVEFDSDDIQEVSNDSDEAEVVE